MSRSSFQFSSDGENTPAESSTGIFKANENKGREDEYTDPPQVSNLAETAPGAVVGNANEAHRVSHHNLEEELGRGLDVRPISSGQRAQEVLDSQNTTSKVGPFATDVFIWAHLVVFSILGTLARVGLSLLTAHPSERVHLPSLWPNFAGSLVLGFLSEGAELFHHPRAALSLIRRTPTTENDSGESSSTDPSLPVPLHIGLATGFCGSFTTYSAFICDCFEALSGMPGDTRSTPSPGQDFLSVAAVIIITLSLAIGGLKTGAHMAIFLNRYEKKLPRHVLRGMDRASVVLAIVLWATSIVMAIMLATTLREEAIWWGQMLLSLAFAPLGTLLRFKASMWLNSRIVGFPLGTFCVNMFGTLVLAVVWDLQRLPDHGITTANSSGDLISCQVLQAIEDGLCGCLTTVSTWVLELSTLRRTHSYQYGITSLATSLMIVVVVMGPLKWTVGLSQPVCASS
ncbi:CrcB-like protein-domain-containing protein [Diaporthe sp. PMI_573]|nr:CrcB-like protein-domain-containing protein [Diaporthaceae sp. PMI_573]